MIKRKNLYAALTAILFFHCAHAAEEQKQTESNLTKGLSALSFFLEQKGNGLRRDKVYESNRLYWSCAVQKLLTQNVLPTKTIAGHDCVRDLQGRLYAVRQCTAFKGKSDQSELYDSLKGSDQPVLSVPCQRSGTERNRYLVPFHPAINPHAPQVVVAKNAHTFLVIDTDTLETVTETDVEEQITQVKFCPDQNVMLLRSGSRHTLFDAQTWREKATLDTDTRFGIFPDNTDTLAVSHDDTMSGRNTYKTTVWDLKSQKPLYEMEHRQLPRQHCFSSDNELVALVNSHYQGTALEIYKPTEEERPEKPVRRYALEKAPVEYCIGFNFNRAQNCAAITYNDHCFLVDINTGTIRKIYTPLASMEYFDPTEQFLSIKSRDGWVTIWEIEDAAFIASIPLPHAEFKIEADSFIPTSPDFEICDCTYPPRNELHFNNARYFLTCMHQETNEWITTKMSPAQLLLLEKARLAATKTRNHRNPKPELVLDPREANDHVTMPQDLKTTMATLVTLKNTLSEKTDAPGMQKK